MSYVTNVIFHCDRCHKEIIPDTGTLNENRYRGLQLIGSHAVNASGKIEDTPDLCDDCLSSLENWFSSDEYKRVESCWDIEIDIPTMDLAMTLMAKRVIEYRKALNDTGSEDIGGFLIKDLPETKQEFLDQARSIQGGLI